MLDLIIIGCSAAGISAAIYAARRNLNFKIVTYDLGGEMAISGEIENLPGWGKTNGVETAKKFQEHLKFYNLKPEAGVEILKISPLTDGSFEIIGQKGAQKMKYQSKSVIVATGLHPKKLNIPGEEKYRRKGLSYCTVCDGPLFKNKTVATIGGGNSSLESALMLNEFASKVYLINKNPQFKGDKIIFDKVQKANKVEIIYNALTLEISGGDFIKELTYKDKNNQKQTLKVDGVFVHIGMIPNSQFVPEQTLKNQYGEIITDQMGQTNIKGLFAAGDVTNIPYKQIAIASGQGVIAALSVVDYLNKSR